jgi:hypothetical protein
VPWKNAVMSGRGSPGRDEFVHAFDAPSRPLGEIARAKLESEGVSVMVKGGTSYTYPTGTMQLWVPRHQLERARSILDSVDAGAAGASGEGEADGRSGPDR